MLTHQFANTGHFKDLACDLELPGIGKKQMLMNGCLLQQLPGSPTGILLAMEDLTKKTGSGLNLSILRIVSFKEMNYHVFGSVGWSIG